MPFYFFWTDTIYIQDNLTFRTRTHSKYFNDSYQWTIGRKNLIKYATTAKMQELGHMIRLHRFKHYCYKTKMLIKFETVICSVFILTKWQISCTLWKIFSILWHFVVKPKSVIHTPAVSLSLRIVESWKIILLWKYF